MKNVGGYDARLTALENGSQWPQIRLPLANTLIYALNTVWITRQAQVFIENDLYLDKAVFDIWNIGTTAIQFGWHDALNNDFFTSVPVGKKRFTFSGAMGKWI